MKKVRLTALLLAAVCVLLLFASCANKPAKTPAVADVTNTVMQGQTFPEMIPMTDRYMEDYYGADLSLVQEFSAYITSSGATADEVVVIRVKEEKDAKTALEWLTTRQSDQKASFTGYVDSEVPRIEKAAIGQKGCYVYLLICPDTAKAKADLEAQF